ncbi:hypothetical protein [Rhizorhabdus argentea]|uniref:hypothetical protein n=1 Tax=Rhizorhabdus argentea TaxID=1387174 RepID=UPI0030ECE8A1
MGRFAALWLVEGLVFVPLALSWWLTPLGYGFAHWPNGRFGEALKYWYLASLFAGAPLLLIGWLLSPMAAMFKKMSLAIGLPIAAFLIFLMLALPVFVLV